MAQPSASQLMADMVFSADSVKRVMNGEFVTEDLDPVSDSDLSVAIAFLVKASPDELSKQIVAGDLITADPQVQANGEISGNGSLADFAALPMTSDVAKAYSDAKAGSSLNLSNSEITAFKALQGGDQKALQQQLQSMLLTRLQSYRSTGLAGIPTYDRGGKASDPGGDLRLATKAAHQLTKYLPSLQQLLLDYPKGSVPGLSQNFYWATYNADGKPTYVLTHVLAASEGAARAVVQRQYYVSTGYNAEQAIAAFLPVQEGTVIVYGNHTFTDQVAGFGGSMKRKIGRKMMESQLEKVFQKGRGVVGQ
jgi:hypothetical protein